MAAGVARDLAPGVVEAEVSLTAASMYAFGTGHAAIGDALGWGAAAVPVAGAGAFVGSMAGGIGEGLAIQAGLGRTGAVATGALSAAQAGAGAGALVGVAPGEIDALPGAIVGGVAGLAGHHFSRD